MEAATVSCEKYTSLEENYIFIFIYSLELGFHPVAVVGRFVQEIAQKKKEYTKQYKNTEDTNRKQKYKTRKQT
jgi:cell division protein FtsB